MDDSGDTPTLGRLYRDRRAWDKVVPQDLRADPRWGPAFGFMSRAKALPNVLIIGDSISMGYTPTLRALLNFRARVLRIPDNGRSTDYSLSNLHVWLGPERWDLIVANWGLHDLAFREGRAELGPTVGLAAYETNLTDLIRRLQDVSTKVLLATTTPVPPGASTRLAGSEKRYNLALDTVARAWSIPTVDLWGVARRLPASRRIPRDVHFTASGSARLGEAIARDVGRLLDPPD